MFKSYNYKPKKTRNMKEGGGGWWRGTPNKGAQGKQNFLPYRVSYQNGIVLQTLQAIPFHLMKNRENRQFSNKVSQSNCETLNKINGSLPKTCFALTQYSIIKLVLATQAI